ncbi:MAG: hypothetical protein Q4E02_00210 [Lagierella massiliensis]|nr:hypothetical protein [Lagierella massiliensis]
MLNKKKTITLLIIFILIIIAGGYIFTGGGVLLSKVKVEGKTLRLRENDGVFGFTSGEKYEVGDIIESRYLNVTLDNVEIADSLGNLLIIDKEDQDLLEKDRVKEGDKLIRLDFTIENKGDFEEEINWYSSLKSQNFSSYATFTSEINEEDKIHNPFLVKIKPGEVKKNSIGFLVTDDELKNQIENVLSYRIILPLREKSKDDEVDQVEYFYFNPKSEK